MPIDAQLLQQIDSNDKALAQVDLSFNEIDDEGAKALAAALEKNQTLTQVNLEGNHIGTELKNQINQKIKGNQQRYRNQFIARLYQGLVKLNEQIETQAYPLPPELIHHIGTFLPTSFYLQLASIQYPSQLGKEDYRVYQCALFLLHRFAIGQLAPGIVIEQQPKPGQRLSYHQHFLFKPVPDATDSQVEPKAKCEGGNVTPVCFI